MSFYRPYRSRNWSHTNAFRSSPSYTPVPADPAESERIEAVINNPAFSSLPTNKQDFIKSIKGQAASKKLSEAQVNYLTSIEKSLVPVDNSWWNAEDPENIKKRDYAVAHYAATGYYLTTVAKMKEDPTYMPEQGIWDKMWGNKFINAGYKRHSEGPRWSVGNLVCAKSYSSRHNSIIQKVNWSFNERNWFYEVVTFEGRIFVVSENDTIRVQGDNTRRSKKQE
jgi:hypothetical protein